MSTVYRFVVEHLLEPAIGTARLAISWKIFDPLMSLSRHLPKKRHTEIELPCGSHKLREDLMIKGMQLQLCAHTSQGIR